MFTVSNKNDGLSLDYVIVLLLPCRNVCLWDTLVTPANSLVHGKKPNKWIVNI